MEYFFQGVVGEAQQALSQRNAAGDYIGVQGDAVAGLEFTGEMIFADEKLLTREELEEEAEFNERTAESIQDPLVTRIISGKEVTLPASRWHEVSTEVLDVLVPEWVDYERFKRSPEGYELLKKKYKHWKEHHEDEYRW